MKYLNVKRGTRLKILAVIEAAWALSWGIYDVIISRYLATIAGAVLLAIAAYTWYMGGSMVKRARRHNYIARHVNAFWN